MSEQLPKPDSFGEEGPAALRDAYKRATKRIAELESVAGTLEGELKGSRIAKAGFEEGSEGYNLLADFYNGDLTDVEGMQEFAAKYGHKAVAGGEPPSNERAAAEGRMDKLRNDPRTGAADGPKSREQELVAEIQRLEAEGKYTDTIPLKTDLDILRKQPAQV